MPRSLLPPHGAFVPTDIIFSKEFNPTHIYRMVTGLKLNHTQSKLLSEQVQDVEIWRQTIMHWLLHNWSPLNLPGLRELYQGSGVEFCCTCNSLQNRKPPSQVETQLETLAEMRGELDHFEEPDHGDPPTDPACA